jgi:CO/xanthine dehydrogenase Mo-binding subunit
MSQYKLSRRQFIKNTGALIVSFNLFPTAAKVFAQSAPTSAGDLDPQSLDSWIAIAQDGTVTIFTSKVELGTGIETALLRLPRRGTRCVVEACQSHHGRHGSLLSTNRQPAAAAPWNAPALRSRQAAAAARKELLRRAAESLRAPVEKLAVRDSVVSVQDSPSKQVSYAQLIGGKPFNVKITAEGTAAELKLAQNVPAKHIKEYSTVGTTVPRFDLPPKLTGEAIYIHDVRILGMLHGRVVSPPIINTDPLSIDEAGSAFRHGDDRARANLSAWLQKRNGLRFRPLAP